MNVYVPDELKERLDGAGLNLSVIARRAWEIELELATLGEGEMRIDVGEEQLQFTGTLLAQGNEVDLYLTEDDLLVCVGEEQYWTMPRDELVDSEGLWPFLGDEEAIAEAAPKLGLKRIVRL